VAERLRLARIPASAEEPLQQDKRLMPSAATATDSLSGHPPTDAIEGMQKHLCSTLGGKEPTVIRGGIAWRTKVTAIPPLKPAAIE